MSRGFGLWALGFGGRSKKDPNLEAAARAHATETIERRAYLDAQRQPARFRHARIRRLNQSTTTTRYTKPRAIGIYEMSMAHT